MQFDSEDEVIVMDKEHKDVAISLDAPVKTPLPKGEMVAMAFLFFTEGYNFTFVFSVSKRSTLLYLSSL